MNYKLKIISKKNITENEIINLCKLKTENWNYNISEQIEWWNKNSEENYIIASFIRKRSFLAFLRMRERRISFNNKPIHCFCITEVCVAKKDQGKGWGKKLIEESKKFIKKMKMPAYLLCSNNQRKFYQKCNLKLAKKFDIIPDKKNYKKKDINCFFFNLKCTDEKIILYGNSF